MSDPPTSTTAPATPAPTPATSAAAAPPDEGPASFTMSHRQILTILLGLMMGMFLAALDQTIVATAIKTIGDDLNGLSLQAWVTTAYLITSTISTPLYGKLSDIYGRKPLYLISIGLFLAGSLLCGTATSMYQLAGYRAIQGLGGGGLMSLAITILGDMLSPRERAKYQAYILAVFGVSSVLGPIIGGFFADAATFLGITGWRWIFLVNVPLGVAGVVVIWRVLHLPPLRRVTHRIDWPGALLLAAGLVPLLLVAEQGREWGWASPVALTCYGVGVVGLALFVLAESRAGDDALLPLRLFRNRTFGMGAIVNTVIGMGMFGALAGLPLFLQISKGMSPTAAGLALLPLTLGIMVTSVVSGQTIGRTGHYRTFPILGTAFLVVGAFLLSRVHADMTLLDVGWRSAVFGAGLGFCFQPLVLAVQNAVPPRDMGVATSSSLFFRQMGGTLGTAVFLSILFSTVGDKIGAAFQAASGTPAFQAALADESVTSDPANAPVIAMLQGGGDAGGGAVPSLNDSSFINHLDPRLAAPFLEGFAQSIGLVMLVAACVLVVAFALSFTLPQLALRQVSGIQSRLDEDAAGAPGAEGREDVAATSQTASAVAASEQGIAPEAIRAEGVTPER
ncbi:MDR family MFS transporter [Actinotalea fermentans]|uniref:MDR family MFS transporter n=1 Tax=Actinotalea fermentans TaxID=43671 RepID=UPI0021BF7618|nr:MDR family MFS transporter [Actinotalea fermentans]